MSALLRVTDRNARRLEFILERRTGMSALLHVMDRGVRAPYLAAAAPAASASSAARWVLSQLNSRSLRPKCPPAAVRR